VKWPLSAFGTKRTCIRYREMSAFGGKADIALNCRPTRFVHPLPHLVRLGFSGFLIASLILTTDFGWSLRGVVNTKPGGHVARARSSSTVFSKTPVSGSALTFMSVGKPARARRSSWMFAGTFRNSTSGFISYGSASDSGRAARASQYHRADIGPIP